MARVVPPFLKALQDSDPEAFPLVNDLINKSGGRGALDPKTKTLIMLALDALANHPDGVKSLAMRARALGASEDEIKETMRVAFTTACLQCLIPGLKAFEK